jgi:hypothetical protein
LVVTAPSHQNPLRCTRRVRLPPCSPEKRTGSQRQPWPPYFSCIRHFRTFDRCRRNGRSSPDSRPLDNSPTTLPILTRVVRIRAAYGANILQRARQAAANLGAGSRRVSAAPLSCFVRDRKAKAAGERLLLREDSPRASEPGALPQPHARCPGNAKAAMVRSRTPCSHFLSWAAIALYRAGSWRRPRSPLAFPEGRTGHGSAHHPC